MIEKVVATRDGFTISNQMLTETRKIIRKNVALVFEDELAQMFNPDQEGDVDDLEKAV